MYFLGVKSSISNMVGVTPKRETSIPDLLAISVRIGSITGVVDIVIDHLENFLLICVVTLQV